MNKKIIENTLESKYLDKIICGDCLDVMQKLPDCSVDLVVTSPPYNLRNTTGGGVTAIPFKVFFC